MTAHPDRAGLGRLKSRIQGLRSKTTDNGGTEAQALLAAAKVAELLDRYDLSLTDVEISDAPCEQREYETYRKKRIPLDARIGAIANFCDCRVWREKNQAGEARYVFFGLRSDVEVAHYLTELIDNAVRSELGRYKTSVGYRRFRQDSSLETTCAELYRRRSASRCQFRNASRTASYNNVLATVRIGRAE